MTYLAPSDPSYIQGTVVGSQITGGSSGAAGQCLVRVTVNRSGYWAAAGYYHTTGGQEGASHQLVAEIKYNGVVQGSVSMTRAANTNDGGVGVYAGPVLISSGQTIELWGSKGYNNAANVDGQAMRAWFMPSPNYLA